MKRFCQVALVVYTFFIIYMAVLSRGVAKQTYIKMDLLQCYLQPRDLDGGQPMLKGLPLKRKFKSYVGLKGAAEKLRQYLKDFKFTDVKTAAENIYWEKVPVVEV